MFRLIIWFLIIYFGYTLFKKFFKKTPEDKMPNPNNKEKMIQCENCKIYFPESSKIAKNGKNFCSKRCAESYEKD